MSFSSSEGVDAPIFSATGEDISPQTGCRPISSQWDNWEFIAPLNFTRTSDNVQ